LRKRRCSAGGDRAQWWNGADGHAAADVGALILNASARSLHLVEDGTGVRQEGAARLRKPDAAAEPVE